MVVMEDGPCRCLTPIPRMDLAAGCDSFRLPNRLSWVTYRLAKVEDGVHHYRQETP